MWENLGVTKSGRCVRFSFQTLISLILLLITTGLILFVKVKETELKEDKVTCAVGLGEELSAE